MLVETLKEGRPTCVACDRWELFLIIHHFSGDLGKFHDGGVLAAI